MHFSSLQNGLINCLNVSIRLVVFEQYSVYHSICPNCLQFLRSIAEFFVPSTLVTAMFRKSGMLDRSKCAFHTPKSAASKYRNDHKDRADVHCELSR